MTDNKELLNYLGIDQNCAEAKKLNALADAVNNAVLENTPNLNPAIVKTLLGKTEGRKKYAIKNMFAAFDYKYALAGLAITAVLITTPLLIKNGQAHDTDIYSYQTYLDFNSFDEELQEISLELENI